MIQITTPRTANREETMTAVSWLPENHNRFPKWHIFESDDEPEILATAALCGIRVKEHVFLTVDEIDRVAREATCLRCAKRNRELMSRAEAHGMNR